MADLEGGSSPFKGKLSDQMEEVLARIQLSYYPVILTTKNAHTTWTPYKIISGFIPCF